MKTITENESANGVYGAAIFGQKSPLILGAALRQPARRASAATFVDEDGKPTINSPEAVAAAQALVDVIRLRVPDACRDRLRRRQRRLVRRQGRIHRELDRPRRRFGDEPRFDGRRQVGRRRRSPSVATTPRRARRSWPASPGSIAANTEKTDLAKAFIEFAASSEVNSAADRRRPADRHRPEPRVVARERGLRRDVPRPAAGQPRDADGSLAWPTGENASQAAQILTDELAKLIAGEGVPRRRPSTACRPSGKKILG